MKIARFAQAGQTTWGFVAGEEVLPLVDPPPLVEVIGDLDALHHLRATAGGPIALDQVDLLAPVPDPPQFMGIGLNYRKHALESGVEPPSSPIMFPFFNSSITDPGRPIVLPPFTEEVDWEVELAVVIGRTALNVPREQAVDYIAGYTIVNDVSARDIQMGEGQWSRGKSFDTFKPMGPWITTVDELDEASGLDIQLWVNDQLKQSSDTSDLVFDVPDLVSFLSRSLTLLPGAVIATGTPAGVGFARTPPEFLSDGDVVRLAVAGIGELTNPVTA